MLGIVLAAVVMASPSPSPTPLLKTIVTVRSSPLCGEFAAHTNAAISSTVSNDEFLGTTILTLRSGDLAGSSLDRLHEIHALSKLADSIYRAYRAGEAEVNRLRDVAKSATDPDEKQELEASADALGGALYRQHLIQRDLDGFVAFLDASDMMTSGSSEDYLGEPRHPQTLDMPDANPAETTAYWMPQVQDALWHPPLLAGSESLEQDLQMAQAASDDFKGRMPDVMKDELNAAGHIELAADHC
ncbi:MAG TPA: hypothetical protein VMD47_11475 [Candidatus Acidoferrales bacterium]|nr:hypothetical protein [Candidatus Acidoferrales bacterium]